MITQLVDHHPYPLLLTDSGWILLLDTTKYQKIMHNCPYIPDLLHLISDTYYSNILYAISRQRILVLTVDHHKKTCTSRKDYLIKNQIPAVNTSGLFETLIFINGQIYNTTSR